MGLSTTYTKAETLFLIQELEKKTTSGYKGDLIKTDVAPTTVGFYGLLETGVYTNLGGINAPTGKLNFASFDGTTWSLIATDLPQPIVNNYTNNNTYNLDPEQIVPSEALYTDDTLAGDILKRVDKATGENVNYRETTTWYDGSAMDDSKTDGVIFIKKGEKYYVRQYNDYVNVKWFGAKGGESDDTNAFILADKWGKVYVPNGVYYINTHILTANYYGDSSVVKNRNYDNILKFSGQKIISDTKINFNFIGVGLNDLTFNGDFELANNTTLIVEIDKINQTVQGEQTDTFKYSLDNGSTWIVDNLTINPIDDSETLLPLCCKDRNWLVGYSGIKIDFSNSIGHSVGDKWKVDLVSKPRISELIDVVRHNGQDFIQTKQSGGLIIGKNSGSASDLGAGSVIIGSNSFQKNVQGYSNVGLGNYVLTNNVSGSLNVAIGDYSLHKNTTGRDNVSVGVYAMFDNVSGYGNLAVGQDALRYNTTGYLNSAGGAQSLYFNIGGIGNSGFGNSALRGNINGISNTAVGKSSLLKNQNGNTNTAIGSDSLYNMNGGNDNVAVGESAGFKLTTGNKNTFLGRISGGHINQKVDAINSTAIGHNAYTNKDNQIVLGDENIEEIIARSLNTNLGSIANMFNFIFSKHLYLGELMSFATNTDARNAGLAVGEVYKKSDGTLMIVY